MFMRVDHEDDAEEIVGALGDLREEMGLAEGQCPYSAAI